MSGDCFVVAFQLALANDWTLCHGLVVRHADGLVHAHAWCEYTVVHDVPVPDGGHVSFPLEIAVDRANGNDVALPMAFYRRAGRCHEVREYSPDEAARIAVASGHYGPWP